MANKRRTFSSLQYVTMADTVPLFFPASLALVCAIALVRGRYIAAVHSNRGINLWKYQFNDPLHLIVKASVKLRQRKYGYY